MGLVKVQIIVNDIKMDKLIDALKRHKVTGLTGYKAMGCGVQYGTPEYKEEDTSDIKLLEKTVVDLVMPEDNYTKFIEDIEKNLYTGHIGDGKIFVYDIKTAYRVRTGEEGYDAVRPPKI